MAYCCTPHSGPNLKRNKNAYFAQERPKGAFNKNPIVFNELQKIDFSLAQKQTRFHLAPPNSFALQAKFMFSRKTTKFEKNIHRRIDVRERPLMTSLVFWPFLTYLPTLSYSITSLFWGYLGPPYLP